MESPWNSNANYTHLTLKASMQVYSIRNLPCAKFWCKLKSFIDIIHPPIPDIHYKHQYKSNLYETCYVLNSDVNWTLIGGIIALYPPSTISINTNLYETYHVPNSDAILQVVPPHKSCNRKWKGKNTDN